MRRYTRQMSDKTCPGSPWRTRSLRKTKLRRSFMWAPAKRPKIWASAKTRRPLRTIISAAESAPCAKIPSMVNTSSRTLLSTLVNQSDTQISICKVDLNAGYCIKPPFFLARSLPAKDHEQESQESLGQPRSSRQNTQSGEGQRRSHLSSRWHIKFSKTHDGRPGTKWEPRLWRLGALFLGGVHRNVGIPQGFLRLKEMFVRRSNRLAHQLVFRWDAHASHQDCTNLIHPYRRTTLSEKSLYRPQCHPLWFFLVGTG